MSNDKVSKNMRKILNFLFLVVVSFAIMFLLGYQEEDLQEIANVQGELEIIMFDVGQADSILLRQNEHTMLVDCATSGQAKNVLKRLEELGVEKLDYLILTHPHSDHMGGAAEIISKYGNNIGSIYMPNYSASIVTTAWQTKMQKAILERSNLVEAYLTEYDTLEKEIEFLSESEQELYMAKKTDDFFVENGCVVHPKVGDTLTLGDANITFIAPSDEAYTNLNNYSIAFRVAFGNVSAVFVGDAEVLSEKEMIKTGIELDSDILKLGHHGSNTSSSEEFLNAVSPERVLISCKLGHKDENPDAEVAKRLEKGKYVVYRTDENGEFSVTTDGSQIQCSTEPGDYLSGIELAEREEPR